MTAADPRPLPALPDLARVRHVHVIGVCGTAMGTLAAMLRARGYTVTGSDANAYPPMSDWLADRGIAILPGYAAEHLPASTDLVITGNVARRDNPEVLETARRGLPALSLPEALRVLFFPGRTGLVITGTHGKTTTTAWTAWNLFSAGRDPSFFVGGVTGNFGSNYRLGDGAPFVIEGDEYDTAWFDKVPKFWHYPARFATINNVEFDHADIYPDLDAIRHVFTRFAAQVEPDGQLWVNGDDAEALRCAAAARAPVRTFGLHPRNELCAEVLGTGEDGTRIRVSFDGRTEEALLPTIGAFNVRNFLGAFALSSCVGVTLDDAIAAAPGFRAVRKRQELRGVARGVRVYDDFAHHPTAVRETLDAIRARHPDRRVIAVFEAKSNTSRRSVFQHDYPPAFRSADEVVLSAPWRQDALPEDQKISIPRMADDIRAMGIPVELIPEVPDIVRYLAGHARSGDVIVGLSGSAFGGLHDAVLAALNDEKTPSDPEIDTSG